MKKNHAVCFLLALTSLALSSCGQSTSSVVASSGNSATSSSSASSVMSGALADAANLIAKHVSKDGVSLTGEALLASNGYKATDSLTKIRFFNLLYKAYVDHMPTHQEHHLLL